MTNTTLEQRFDEFLNRDRRSEDFYKSYLGFVESEIALAKETSYKEGFDSGWKSCTDTGGMGL